MSRLCTVSLLFTIFIDDSGNVFLTIARTNFNKRLLKRYFLILVISISYWGPDGKHCSMMAYIFLRCQIGTHWLPLSDILLLWPSQHHEIHTCRMKYCIGHCINICISPHLFPNWILLTIGSHWRNWPQYDLGHLILHDKKITWDRLSCLVRTGLCIFGWPNQLSSTIYLRVTSTPVNGRHGCKGARDAHTKVSRHCLYWNGSWSALLWLNRWWHIVA